MDILRQLSQQSKQIVGIAKKEASIVRNSTISTEHILIGILKHGSNIAIDIFVKLEIDIPGLIKEIENIIITTSDKKDVPLNELAFSESVITILQLAANSTKGNKIQPQHLLVSMLYDTNNTGSHLLSKHGITNDTIKAALKAPLKKEIKETESYKPVSLDEYKALNQYTINLTQKALTGNNDPVIGRKEEIDRCIKILCRKTKNNPALIGEPGVGKTAIAEGLAQLIVKGEVPDKLKNHHVLFLDITHIVSGTKLRGQFEERIYNIVEEAIKCGKLILFIDEMHTLVGSGNGADSSLDVGNILKPALARGKIKTIGATTLSEYRKYIEPDGALERRFQPIIVKQPSPVEVYEILTGIKKHYEEFHNVVFPNETIQSVIDLTERFVVNRQFPDKAIDLMDEVGSTFSPVGVSKPYTVTVHDVESTLSNITHIQINSENSNVTNCIINLEEHLNSELVGQSDPINELIVRLKRGNSIFKDPKKPICSFVFIGPSTSGKSFTARHISKYIFNNSLITINMAEYADHGALSKLIGTPPGYFNHQDGGKLSEAVRRNPYSVVLFENINKAPSDIIPLLTQIKNDGEITDSRGNIINFKNCCIIGTITDNNVAKAMGFKDSNGLINYDIKKYLPFEFLEGQKIITFNKLKREDFKNIFTKNVVKYTELIKRYYNKTLVINDDVFDKLYLDNNTEISLYHIEEFFTEKVEPYFLNMALGGDTVTVGLKDSKITLSQS